MTSFNDIQMNDYEQQDSIPSYASIPKIRVIVRKRPLNKKELAKSDTDVVDIRLNRQVVVKELKTKVDLTKYIEEHSFHFDMSFDEKINNETLYLETVRPMIEAAFNKTKVTCFAYGQTGSGKTFTMMGGNTQETMIPGMYLLAAYDIFSLLQQDQYQGFSIWASFYEIYCGKLFDLLNERTQLTAREDAKQNICIVGLTEKNVSNLTALMQLIDYGLRSRTVGVTGANNDSSRSHGIIQITIKNSSGASHGKISFIDLAGSERAADTIDTNKQTRIDGAEINKSLLALKECIRALDQDKKHTPFRGSKLTLVLRDSFIGNCKTLMIANISPSSGCSEHTLNTLRYADRVKELRGKPDITIGSGNVNMNYDPNANAMSNAGKDPQEVLANLLMMPRVHNKSVKYCVDENNNKVKGLGQGENSRNALSNSTNNVKKLSEKKSKTVFNNGNGINMNQSQQYQMQQQLQMQMQLKQSNNQKMNQMQMQMGMGMPQMNYLNNNSNANSNSNPNILTSSNSFFSSPHNSMRIQDTNPNTSSPIDQYKNINQLQVQQQQQQQQGNFQYENKENYSYNNNSLNNQNMILSTPSQLQRESTNSLIFNLDQSNSNSNPNEMLMKSSSNQGDSFAFLDGYTSFNQLKQNPPQQQQQQPQEIALLKKQYEELVNKILNEEKSYIEAHKKHIDEMVSTMKNEMTLINSVEKQANIDQYVDSLLNIYMTQEGNISIMKNRLIAFKSLLNEESELSRKLQMENSTMMINQSSSNSLLLSDVGNINDKLDEEIEEECV